MWGQGVYLRPLTMVAQCVYLMSSNNACVRALRALRECV